MKNTHVLLGAPEQNSRMFGFHTCMLWHFSLKHTMYILPTVLRPIFKLLLKSRALKDLNTSPKIHSTEVRTRLMDKLKPSIPGVNLASLNGACKWTVKGNAGSPYKHMS